MARIEHTIEVNVPLHAVYNQWTQFEEFPRFMEGVREVKQLDDVHLHWRADRNGHEVEWDSEITDQVPDQHIAWRDVSGPGNTGVVNFFPVDGEKTRVQLIMESHPHVAPSEAAQAELLTTQRVEQDLARFKRLLEVQGHESGAWRGEIHFSQPTVSSEIPGHSASPNASTDQSMRRNIDVDDSGKSIFAQQTSPAPGETPPKGSINRTDYVQGGQQTKADADPRTASINDEIGTAGLGTNSTGGIHGAPGSRTNEAGNRQDETQGKQGGSQAWFPNFLQGWDEPMVMMRKMAEEMDQLFERFIGRPIANRSSQGGTAGKWMPFIEVSQHEDHLHISAEVPGIKKEDIHIEVLHDKLTIEGQRHEVKRQSAQGYKRSERSYGQFYRMVPLPQGVDPEKVKASLQDGVLEIIVPLPMPSAQQGRKVNIQSAEHMNAPKH